MIAAIPDPPALRISYNLSWLLAVAATAAAVGGLLRPDLYRDNDFVKTAWLGNDLITQFVALPAMLVALVRARHGSLPAQLVLPGLQLYMFYNYAFYLFGAAFNSFFLLYVAIFALSAYALMTGLAAIDVERIKSRFSGKTPVRWISGFLVLVALPLVLVEGGQSLQFLQAGVLPPTVVESGHPTSVVFALDLSVVVPAMLLSAVLLWKGRAWGFRLGIVMLIMSFFYMLVLLLGTTLLANSGPSGHSDPFMPFYLSVALGSLLCLGVLFFYFSRE